MKTIYSQTEAAPNGWGWLIPPQGAVAIAEIRGGPLAPGIIGTVFFQDVPEGTWISVNIRGLPSYQPGTADKAPIGPFGFHLHETGNCEPGDPRNPFQGAGGHWNPTHEPHGNHAGDFPVLFSNHGKALMGFFTSKFTVSAIIGRSVVIHENPDDFRSQPAGNSGRRLACGVIKPYRY